jgi:cytochrome c-type biogenesis protein CcmH
MMLWIAMAVLAAAACAPLLVALGRARPADGGARQAVAIYRDQLDEVERDKARGLIGGEDADAARTEIARRLLHAGNEAAGRTALTERPRSLAGIAVVAMPVLALAVYLVVGSPHIPDQPLASRPDALELSQIRELIATVEQHLATNPDDAKGWAVVAPVYLRLGRNDDAVHAYQRLVDLLGPNEQRESDLGEAMVQAANGVVTPAAIDTFTTAHNLDATQPRPRFYLALALSQAGKKDDARVAWQSLIGDAPKDAAWLPAAEQQLAMLNGPASGPDAGQVAAAENMSPSDQQQMIETMVAGLADKLKAAPDDPDGWMRLIRSYVVLGRAADATSALGEARTALAAEPGKLQPIEDMAKQLGVAEVTQ